MIAKIDAGNLAEVGAASEASIGSGRFDLTLNLSGSGKSPSELIENLVGEGFVKISEGALNQLKPSEIGRAADKFMARGDDEHFNISEVLEVQSERSGEIKIGSLDIALQLINGKLSLNVKDLGVKPGRLGVNGKLNLKDFAFSGDWTIQSMPTKRAGKLPAVIRRIRGALNSADPLVAKFDSADLERYLTLRRQETEIRELEIEQRKQQEIRIKAQKEAAKLENEAIQAEKKRIQREVEARKALQNSDGIEKTPLPVLDP